MGKKLKFSKNEKQMLSIGSCLIFLLIKESSCRDVLPQSEKYFPDYKVYHNLSALKAEVLKISSQHPNFVKVNWDYTSRKGLSQPVIHISNFTNVARDQKKVKVLLSYGEHARELLPVESMLFLLHNITNSLYSSVKKSNSTFARMVLDKVDLYISAIINPDGRHYVEEKKNYCWRGTSTGVDLNRNFNWNFGSDGSSKDPRDEEYRGPYPFSEPECFVLTDLTQRENFDAFISFHSGIQQIYIPYADSESKKNHRIPRNLMGMMDLAKELSTSTALKFNYGLAHKLSEYTADGTIFDFMAGDRKIPFSMAVELWGSKENSKSKCFDLFNPKSEHLKGVLHTLHPFYEVLFKYLIKWKDADIQIKRGAVHSDKEVQLEKTYMTHQFDADYYVAAAIVILLLVVIIHFPRSKSPCSFYHKKRIVRLKSLSSTFSFSSLVKTS